MSEETATNVAAPAIATPAPEKKAANEGKPEWLDERLERERKSVLKDLGFESLDAAKRASAELKAKQEAEKSAAQKAAELEASVKAKDAETQRLSEVLGLHAKATMSGLTDAQKSAVIAVAGDDAAMQLKTIEALRPTWASAAAPAAQVQAPAVKDTAPAPNAPKDAGSMSAPPSNKDVWIELQKSNPVFAARYAIANGVFDELFKK